MRSPIAIELPALGHWKPDRSRFHAIKLSTPGEPIDSCGSGHSRWTGLLLIPQGLAAAALMPIVGPLTDRFGGGRVVLVGVALLATDQGGVPAGDLGPFAGAAADAFGTTFCWAFWLTLAAILAAIVLARQERRAREAAHEVTRRQPARPPHSRLRIPWIPAGCREP